MVFKNEFLNTIIFIYAKMLFVKIHEDPFISIYGLRYTFDALTGTIIEHLTVCKFFWQNLETLHTSNRTPG